MLLLAFGTMKAQDTLVAAPQKADTVVTMTPDLSDLPDLLRELSVTLEQLSDSVDWEQFERDMERWGAEMEKWGEKMEKWGEQFEAKHGRKHGYHHDYPSNRPEAKKDGPKDKRPKRRSLLLDPHWCGFETGMNMLLDPSAMDVYTGDNDYMAIRPLRSWYFGFNIADVGIAFDRNSKRVGMFTGVGLGWNNYSWKNYIRMTVEDGQLVNTLLPEDSEVKKSKLGVLYLQVPLMLEVRPTSSMYVDLGVTGGIRLAAWNKIKYADGNKEKDYQGYMINMVKCDASLRVGGGDMGFFVNYALVPMFSNNKNVHPLSVGFNLVF